MERIGLFDGSVEIVIGHRITKQIVAQSLEISNSSTFVIVTDSNIAKLHLQALLTEFSKCPCRVLSLIVPPTEAVKNRTTKAHIEDWLLKNKCTRDTTLVALGGGVIGDMIGFVAATFMRGIPVIQIPTTLLAMVDSSIGGKTAVDTIHGKNLIGSFHQPRRIFMDMAYLGTLPRREFVNGMAEVIKTAAIWSEQEFEFLENNQRGILGFLDDNSNQELANLVLKAIMGSAKVKAHVVTVDEKESGLRGLLNFGHSIGHAIEAIMTPNLLHGECVSIGMIREAEISRHLGHLNDVSVNRLTRCLQSYGLPISLKSSFVQQHAPTKHCSVSQMMDILSLDKKNKGTQKRIVLLSGIGKTYEPRASDVSDLIIRKILSPSLRIHPPSSPSSKKITLNVPGSKSISNRALVLAALGRGECRLQGLLHSDDVQVMLNALQKLVGIEFSWEDDGATLVIIGGQGKLTSVSEELYLGNAGTASRFLTSVVALINQGEEPTILTGNERMKCRPIGPLVDALNENGCAIDFMESVGSLPILIRPKGLQGGVIKLEASVSSQYVSSILMAAPYALQPTTLILTGDNVVSQPYIDMTISMMKSFGIPVARQNNTYTIPKSTYTNPSTYIIEADASSATYPLAFAAVTGSTVEIANMGKVSLQGDSEFAVKVLAEMGCEVSQTDTTTTVKGGSLKGISLDMESMTDAFLTASVLGAVAEGKTRIWGIENQRVKECDRIAAMVEQLSRFSIVARENPDGLEIEGIRDRRDLDEPVGGVKCYDDHRVAMSFSILGCAMTGGQSCVINEKKCVEKTWPGWWDTLESVLGVEIEGVDPEVVKNDPKDVNSEAEKPIVLIGMRGAGKSTSGRAISKALDRQFIDMDEYLEKELGSSIPETIKSKGWEYFREKESLFLQQVLSSKNKNLVVACGGGIVETQQARDFLKQFAGRDNGLSLSSPSSRQGHVIHIKRSDINEVVDYLSSDKTRPMIGEDLIAVWNRRKNWYDDCKSAEFIITKRQALDNWSSVEKDLIDFIQFIVSKSPSATDISKFFLSLTFDDVESITPELMRKIIEGVDAVELRVDLLKSWDIDFVGNQVASLRRLLSSHGNLPIIFTVRTQGQAGKYPDSDVEGMMNLLYNAIYWGIEYIDVEVFGVDGGVSVDLNRKKLVNELVKCKGKSKIIASFHDLKSTTTWKSTLELNGDDVSSFLYESKIRMQDIYERIYPHADIIKLIGTAKNLKDNFDLYEFVNNTVPSLGLAPKPLIALNMGSMGKISRALNLFLSPVTHPALLTSAAPGQLSVSQINQLRYNGGLPNDEIGGLLQKRYFYLFGTPIAHSFSPLLHNTGFKVLGFPYEYLLHESSDWKAVAEFIKSSIADKKFGGASVTIPLKEDLLKPEADLFDHISEAVKEIGAVNTISCVYDEYKGSNTLRADNTDWLGIKACVINSRGGIVNQNANCKIVGAVIGAGGTSRAACFALKKLKCDEIRIWNRTASKSKALASHFGGINAVDHAKDLFPSSEPVIYYVVSTVPSSAHSGELGDELFSSLTRGNVVGGILVEMAYKPRETRMMKNWGKLGSNFVIAEGVEVLIEQGYEQFVQWASMKAPKYEMRKRVLEEVENSQ